jgi:hypothetical protein
MICADGYITHAVDTEPPVFDDNYPNIIHAVPQIYDPAQQAPADPRNDTLTAFLLLSR